MSTDQATAQFEAGIWYSLSQWPALRVAIDNQWGGPDSAGKRDWFAGAISDLFVERPDTDQIDVETVLLQIMQDEFDVNVEDETEVPVALEIMRLRRDIAVGDFAFVEELKARWETRKSKAPVNVNVVDNYAHDHDHDDEDDEEDDEDEGEDDDVDMQDAAEPARTRQEPEIDEDGFTKVTGKKRR